MNFEALANAIIFTGGGLLVFGLVCRMVGKTLPVQETPQAIFAGAVVLGAAIIIAMTMH